MNATTTHIKAAESILIILVFAIIVAVIGRQWFPTLEIIPFIGVASTLAIALLTVAYVIVTSRQLLVMENQLAEMAKSRQLDAQPLPVLLVNKVFLEKPHFYYSPPDNEYSAQTRLFVEFKIINQGTHPTVNLIVNANPVFKINDKPTTLGGDSDHVSILGPGMSYPSQQDQTAFLMFNDLRINELVSILRDKEYRNPPYISIKISHKNLLGACFANTWIFQFMLKDQKDFPTAINWQSRLTSFKVEYKDEIQKLEKIREKDEENWSKLLHSLRDKFKETLQGGDKLELASTEISTSFSSEVISPHQYELEKNKGIFGRPIPTWITQCVAESDAERRR